MLPWICTVKMNDRTKYILQLARQSCDKATRATAVLNNENYMEKETECPRLINLSPARTENNVLNHMELDGDTYLEKNCASDLSLNLAVTDMASPNEKSSIEVGNEHIINSTESSPVSSLPPDMLDILNSDDSYVDKDYLPEECETDCSDDDTNLLLLQKRIKSSKMILSDENMNSSEATQILSDINVAAPSQTIPFHKEKEKVCALKKWPRSVRKERTARIHSGKSYVNVNGKFVAARQLKDLKDCRKKCSLLLSRDIRQQIFNEYWSLGSHDRRVTFIANLINSKQTKVSRKRKIDSLKNRDLTYEYFLEVNGKRVSVCKDCFCKTLDEKEKFIKNVLKNKTRSISGITLEDQRGKTPSANKKTQQELDEVRNHILSFPSHESHYTRRVNDKRYLPSYLNLRIMYDLYKEGKQNPVGRTIYEREFHNLKLSFKKPYVDTCYKCDTLNMQIQVACRSGNEEDKLSLERKLQFHQDQADAAYGAKNIDKTEARNNSAKKCFSFDLQQCLPTPFIASSVAFYKRQLWTYNLTVHDNGTGESTHYMWHEALGSRGGNEIASCLYRHLKGLPETVKEATFYSDTCGGQNKNSHVAAMFIKVQSENPNLTINHKFLISGHTHMECDVDHSMIEKQKKKMKTPIYHPHDWYQLVRATGKKIPFKVYEMQQQDFFDFSLLKSVLVCRKKNVSGEQFLWHSVQWLQYKEKGLVYYKSSLSNTEDFKTLSFLRRGKNHSLKDFPVPAKYSNGFLPISIEKKRDLCSLPCLIPPVFHEFYNTLPTSANVVDKDPDLEEVDDDQN